MVVSTTTYADVKLPNKGLVSLPVGLFMWVIFVLSDRRNNEWVSSTGGTFATVDPATGADIAHVAHASQADVDAAVKAARVAFNTTWGLNVDGCERVRLLNKLADLIERDADILTAIESLDAGKGVRMVAQSDIPGSIDCLRYYAGLADKAVGQTINQFGKSKFAYTVQQPVGVCGQIIPWNYPLMMWSWKVGPALAAGCTIVMKPSELTPLSALYMCNLVKEAGFPPGVVNTVPGLGSTTGEAVSRHLDIDKVAFTGSVATGRRISVAAAESNLKKVTLELGGKSPSLVFPSADLEQAANWVALGIYYNSGQDCCASSRTYVHESVYDDFVALLKDKAATVPVGAPSERTTSFGPLISAGQRDKVLGYIDSARQEGATVTGGKARETGFYVEPTIITGITQNMKCVREEIFGPVIAVGVFKTEDEAIALANDTTYGLAAGVFSNDVNQVARVTAAINAGTVWVNNYCNLSPRVPFGGFKESGVGRELGSEGLEAYLQTKAVHQNIGSSLSWPF